MFCRKLCKDGLTSTFSAFRFPCGDKSSVQGFQFSVLKFCSFQSASFEVSSLLGLGPLLILYQCQCSYGDFGCKYSEFRQDDIIYIIYISSNRMTNTWLTKKFGHKKIAFHLRLLLKYPMSCAPPPHVFQLSACPPHTSSSLFNRSPTPKKEQKYHGISEILFLWATSQTPKKDPESCRKGLFT